MLQLLVAELVLLSLKDAILNPSAALQSTAEDFLDSYARSTAPALADLVNCVLRACGSNASLDSDQVMDSDGVVDWLDDLMEVMKKVRNRRLDYYPT